MNLHELTRPLDISDIDFRVQSINGSGYATILAYKDARVDMARLDASAGSLSWQRKHEVISGNLYCHVGIFNSEIREWVWKSDVGTESMTEATKGQSSDSFKRACFNWGIGRELYDYPFISVKLNENEWDNKSGKPRQTYNLKIRDWRWYSEFTDGRLSFLAAKDNNGKLRFKWGEMKPKQIEPEFKASASTDTQIPEAPIVIDESNPTGIIKKKEEAQVDHERERAITEYKSVFGKAPHGRMTTESITNAVKDQLDKIEEDVEDLIVTPIVGEIIEESHNINDYVSMIETFKEAKEFGEWARTIVTKFLDVVSEDELEDFKDLCNNHYKSIS